MFDPELVFTGLRNNSGLLLRVTIPVVRASIPASLPALLLLFVMIAMAPGCGGGSSGVPAAASVPQFQHVVLVVEENHSFSSAMGNSGDALSQRVGVAV
jgi:hypothetical protein